jgi:hypothetical protein
MARILYASIAVNLANCVWERHPLWEPIVREPIPEFEIREVHKGVVKLIDKQCYVDYLFRVEQWMKRSKKRWYLPGPHAEVRANTRRQQKYYRKVMCEFGGAELGYHGDEMHAILQAMFFTYENERGLKYVRSTALGEWDTMEWEDKMSEIRQWFAEQNIYIPLPNETQYNYEVPTAV